MQVKYTNRKVDEENGLIHETEYALEIVHMTIKGGMLRSKMVSDAFIAPREDPIDQTVAVVTFPKLMGCLASGTITGKTWKMDGKGDPGELVDGYTQDARTLTLDDFLSMPDEVGVLWGAAVIRENPTLDSVDYGQDKQPIVTEDAAKKS